MKNKTLLITIAFFVFSSVFPVMAKNKGKHHDNGNHYGQQHSKQHHKKDDRDDDYYDNRHYDDDYRNRQSYRIEKPVDNLIDYSAEKLKREFK